MRTAFAQPAGWVPLPTRFESTSGGGWIIDHDQPVLLGDGCVIAFSVISPQGQTFRNIAAFEATPVAGGVLCAQGRWRAEDGSGEAGTTPLEIYISANGRRFRAP
jgi:hypothetical protein